MGDYSQRAATKLMQSACHFHTFYLCKAQLLIWLQQDQAEKMWYTSFMLHILFLAGILPAVHALRLIPCICRRLHKGCALMR